ncbi:MAG: protein kinase [Lentisphaeria bacterium]|nr:protein kinase [Lentisphaeria bacterium]
MDNDVTRPPRGNFHPFDLDEAETIPSGITPRHTGRFSIGDLIIERYKVLSELGQGGMGVVYRCFDEVSGIEIALKALPPELSHNSLEMEDIKENFQLVSKLIHQNIAITKNLERDERSGDYYLIMECCEEENLRHLIRQKRGPMKLDDVIPIIRQVADALDYAHDENVLHRDIKPGNIMINSRGKIKVLDFGLAAQIHTSMSRVSNAYHGTSGTGPYMAPEQWRGRAQGASADQYALAVMTYEMLAGHLPFENPDPAVLREAVLNESPEKIPGLPAQTMSAIIRAMNKEPSARFERCIDFVNALRGKTIEPAIPKKAFQAEPVKALSKKERIQYFDLLSDLEEAFSEPPEDPVLQKQFNALQQDFELIRDSEQNTDALQKLRQIKTTLGGLESTFQNIREVQSLLAETEQLEEEMLKFGKPTAKEYRDIKRKVELSMADRDYDVAVYYLKNYKDFISQQLAVFPEYAEAEAKRRKAEADAKWEAWEKQRREAAYAEAEEAKRRKAEADAKWEAWEKQRKEEQNTNAEQPANTEKQNTDTKDTIIGCVTLVIIILIIGGCISGC